MNLLAWNIRGIGNIPSIRRLKKLFKNQSLCCAAIFEPKIDSIHLDEIKFRLKCDGSFSNIEGNIWLLWKFDFNCTILHASSQYIAVHASFSNMNVNIFFVHASCDIRLRLDLWNDLSVINSQDPWMII